MPAPALRPASSTLVLRLTFAFLLLATAKAPGGTLPPGRAYVTNARSNTVSVVDMATMRVIDTIPVGISPGDVVVSPDGRTVYVTNTVDSAGAGEPDTISLIDTASNTVVDEIVVGDSPHGIARTSDGSSLYVANTFDDTLAIVNVLTGEVDSIPVGRFPVIPAISPDNARIYVSNGGDGTISVFDRQSLQPLATIQVHADARGIEVTPDGKVAYVGNVARGPIFVIDAERNQVATTIALRSGTPYMIDITPNGRRVYVTDALIHRTLVVDTALNAIVDRVVNGGQPFIPRLTPDGRYLYVPIFDQHLVEVADTVTNSVIASIQVGQGPRSVAFHCAPDGCPTVATPQTPLWTPLAPMPAARQEIGYAALGGRAYAVGGIVREVRMVDDVEYYEAADDAWFEAAPLPRPLHNVAAAATQGRVFAIGGFDTIGLHAGVSDVYAYDPERNVWETRASLPAPRGAAAAGVIDGRIYVAGGLRDGVAVNDFAVYDPANDEWTVLDPLPTPRESPGAAAIGAVLYVVGGRPDFTSSLGVIEAYDSIAGRWRVGLTPMPTARGDLAVAALDGLIFTFGGEGNAADPLGIFASTEAYYPGTDTWRTLPSMPTPRHGMGAAVLGSRILTFGGATHLGFGPSAANEALIPAVGSGAQCPGDCDENGVVDSDELDAGLRFLFNDGAGTSCLPSAFDRDGNGRITAADLLAGILSIADTCPGR